jgi:hypothetical protein
MPFHINIPQNITRHTLTVQQQGKNLIKRHKEAQETLETHES